jgi:hypothetical protein
MIFDGGPLARWLGAGTFTQPQRDWILIMFGLVLLVGIGWGWTFHALHARRR